MSVFKPVFEDINAADINQLVADAQQEGRNIEFKREMYGNADKDRKEFLKDVSSFANSAGGQLIIGIDEDEGVATAVRAVEGNADNQLLRLEGMARAGIEPRIVGLRMHHVQMAENQHVYIVRVPKSWNPPHRVSFKNSNRFYLRSSAGSHEADVEELRALFTNGAEMHERMTEYIVERTELILENNGIVHMARANNEQRGFLVLHILPLAAFAGGIQIDVAAARDLADDLRPMPRVGGHPRINFDGFAHVAQGDPPEGYTQVFRNGVIEATRANIVRHHDTVLRIPSVLFVRYLFESLPSYMSALQALDVPPPFGVSVSLVGAHDAILGLGEQAWALENQYPIDRRILNLPIQIIPDFAEDAVYRRALIPAIHALWNAVGLASADEFLADFN
ncbi:MAG: ATP-binding protein [Roseibium sp.]|nr:ATP-binding protein [Roseibium sp.]